MSKQFSSPSGVFVKRYCGPACAPAKQGERTRWAISTDSYREELSGLSRIQVQHLIKLLEKSLERES